jgi:hypothetical protein
MNQAGARNAASRRSPPRTPRRLRHQRPRRTPTPTVKARARPGAPAAAAVAGVDGVAVAAPKNVRAPSVRKPVRARIVRRTTNPRNPGGAKATTESPRQTAQRPRLRLRCPPRRPRHLPRRSRVPAAGPRMPARHARVNVLPLPRPRLQQRPQAKSALSRGTHHRSHSRQVSPRPHETFRRRYRRVPPRSKPLQAWAEKRQNAPP